MSQALQTADLSPEAVALIKEGTPQPKVAHPVIAPRPVLAEAPEVQLAPSKEPESSDTEKVPVSKVSEEKSKPRVQREKESERIGERTVSRSFRLPESLPEALLRASTERRIARLKPFTQEEMVAEALSQWLKRNGY